MTWRKKSNEAKSAWKCPHICKGTGTPVSVTPTVGNDNPLNNYSSVDSSLKLILEKVSQLDTVVSEIKDLKVSVQFISDRYEEMTSEIKDVKCKNEENKREILRLRSDNEYLYRQLKLVNESTLSLEQKMRANCIEVHGVEYNENENVAEVIESIGSALRLKTEKNNIIEVLRLVSNSKKKVTPNKPPPILVRFKDQCFSKPWLQKRKTGLTSSNIVGGSSQENVYINENLCPQLKELFFNARIQGKKLKYDFVWVKDGKIYMRKNENTKVKCITSLDDIPTGPLNAELNKS